MGNAVNFSRIVIKLSAGDALHYNRALPSADSFLFKEGKKLSQLYPGIRIARLFWSVHRKKIVSLMNRAMRTDVNYQPPDFFSYYAVDYSNEGDGKLLLKDLLDHPQVEWAYPETGALHAPFESTDKYQHLVYQDHLDPAPDGIDAHHAWTVQGGDGQGCVKFVDIEQGWILDHESYHIKQLPFTGLNAAFFQDHGAAVLGVLLMHTGVHAPKGLVPAAQGYVISQWRSDGRFNTADAIMTAIAQLGFGDILLLETQISDHPGGEKLWPIEIQDAVFQAVRLATALGITVIEAAGNGGINLSRGNDLGSFKDQLGRSVLQPGNFSFRDSGAVLVAAASATTPHEKISFSNYGDRIDCYAQGELVYTAGSLPGSSGQSKDSYTRGFGGTSAAAAIIAGAAIAIQSIVEAKYRHRLSPSQLRALFNHDSLTTPSSRGRLVDKIGAMPDLRKIIAHLEYLSTQRPRKVSLHQNKEQ